MVLYHVTRGADTAAAVFLNMNITRVMASIRGFHKPWKHKGMSYEDSFELYIAHLKTSRSPLHKQILAFIEEHQEPVLYLLTKSFRGTLHFRDDDKSKR